MDNKLVSIKERILLLAENVEVSKQEFFRKIEMSYGNFTGNNKDRPINSDAIKNILVIYPQTNPYWLILGNGEMLRDINQNISNNGDGNHNINNNGGNVTISKNDVSTMIELQKGYQDIQRELTDRLKVSQDQINTLLEILKNK
ncbi:MAG: transcriptional regulator [Bergeyella sp.]